MKKNLVQTAKQVVGDAIENVKGGVIEVRNMSKLSIFDMAIVKAMGPYPTKSSLVDLSLMGFSKAVDSNDERRSVVFFDVSRVSESLEKGRFSFDFGDCQDVRKRALLSFPEDIPPDRMFSVVFPASANVVIEVGDITVVNPNTGSHWGVKLSTSELGDFSVYASGFSTLYAFYSIRNALPSRMATVGARLGASRGTAVALIGHLPKRVLPVVAGDSYKSTSVSDGVFVYLTLFGGIFAVGNVYFDARLSVVHFVGPSMVLTKMAVSAVYPGWGASWVDAEGGSCEPTDVSWQLYRVPRLLAFL